MTDILGMLKDLGTKTKGLREGLGKTAVGPKKYKELTDTTDKLKAKDVGTAIEMLTTMEEGSGDPWSPGKTDAKKNIRKAKEKLVKKYFVQAGVEEDLIEKIFPDDIEAMEKKDKIDEDILIDVINLKGENKRVKKSQLAAALKKGFKLR